VPRQRTARLPVLSQSFPRPDGSRPGTGVPVKARIVALALVLVSLALVTMYLRESSDGALHGAQRIAVSVLTPFQVAAERVARPFRDAYGWSADLFAAKGENERLREEVEALRRQAIENQTAAQENEQLRKLLDFREGPRFPADFEPVVTGTSDGIRVDDPVVTDRGLVGTVTEVTPNAAKVRLLTDQQAAASAFVLETNAAGIVVDGPSSSNTLVLDRVPKTERVENGNVVVTAGYRIGRYESLFPRGIPIGVVTSVSQRHIDPYKQIQVTPLVDFESLDEVIVLAEKGRRQ
jgi:rod shape-determining protein MreC